MKKIFLYLLFIILFISRADAQNNYELYISYKFISGIALEYSSSKIIPGQNIGISITGSFGFTSKPNSEFDLSTFSEAILAFPNRGKTASRYIYNIYSVVFLRHSQSNAYFNPDFKLGYMRMSPEQNPKLKRYNSIRFSFEPLFGKKDSGGA